MKKQWGCVNCLLKLNRYWFENAGSIAPLFAVTLPVVIGAVGMGVDMAQAYLVRERLGNALDAATVAAAASAENDEDIESKVEDFFYANYPPEKIGVTYDLAVDIDGDDVHVSASADYYTTFISVLGIDEIPVKASTSVRREVKGLEVAMVLDYTGSMGSYYYGKKNSVRLQEASTSFIETLFSRADEPELVKIGIIPYSTSVNVGSYGLGEYPDGSYYGEPFVNNPMGLDFEILNYSGDSRSQEWGGCVITDGYDEDVTDHAGPWDMYRWCRDPDNNDYPICHYRNVCVKYRGRRCVEYERRPRETHPNSYCPTAPIVPLTSDEDILLDAIDDMDYPRGNTLGNYGMVWGWRVLSSEYPFTEGVEYDNEQWRKAVIMMTDGNNTMNSNYSAYGSTSSHSVRVTQLNNRFLETCENMKEQGIIIYTVTFTSNISATTKGYYKSCATQESYYYDSPDPDDLVDIFGRIGRELSNLHITK